jgi:hypothetical protein
LPISSSTNKYWIIIDCVNYIRACLYLLFKIIILFTIAPLLKPLKIVALDTHHNNRFDRLTLGLCGFDNLLYYFDVIRTLAKNTHQVFGAVAGDQFRQISLPCSYTV